ncbi:protein kinase-like protein [Niveomyces insectorum RCEF 264]|uniref:non-specific serine/threonine protein kinase n=1 Tax=Niveomyces insectorum RCEF 264 TaxID=1081102 RepID=A0A167W9D5_9HYPO|nr:protein kinase-like protein [Niveomyces insectorum RCEF 264]
MASSSSVSPPTASRPVQRGCRPRNFPTSGFEVIDPDQLVEEETLPSYKRDEYYPMRIGDIVAGHYQVAAKLGYGTTSTVWLARDLNKEREFWVLKVHIHTSTFRHERMVYEHLKKTTKQEKEDKEEHPGRDHVRRIEDSFTLKGPHGEHEVFVMTPLGMSLRTMQEMQKTGVFPEIVATRALNQTLLGLALLHDADVIHTDLHADNLLVAMTDDSILSTMEESEMNKPSARKQAGDTTIHVSRYVLGGAGPLTISDLGQARIGREQSGNAMPTQYRAPEVILNMPWGPPVDMWSVGLLAWGLIERESLFRIYDPDSPGLNDAHHLAAMTALLGPPPAEFLQRSKDTSKYWDEQGQWHGPVPMPPAKNLDALVVALEGKQKEIFVDFMECFLAWLPEERFTASQGYFHVWLCGKD